MSVKTLGILFAVALSTSGCVVADAYPVYSRPVFVPQPVYVAPVVTYRQYYQQYPSHSRYYGHR